jgi:hypothetical protein
LKFPEYIKANHYIVPCEVITLTKGVNVTDVKEMDIHYLPPRFVSIDLDWSLSYVHMKIMSVFCHALENKSVQKQWKSQYNNYSNDQDDAEMLDTWDKPPPPKDPYY